MKLILAFLSFLVAFSSRGARAESPLEVHIKEGLYKPFFRDAGEEDIRIGPLWVDRDPVTNANFARFLRANPDWSPSRIPKIFASGSYLGHWKANGSYERASASHPVTNVTWFAARAYCEAQGKRLLTVAEWEFISDAQKPEVLDSILEWYAKPNSLQDVHRLKPNSFGLRGMHGLVWEWVDDFSSVIIVGDSRDSNETNGKLFCGSGSLKAKDPAQYATFMRFAHRSSLKANYAGAVLGFRCARDAK